MAPEERMLCGTQADHAHLIQTLPIGYYPTLADEDLDKILLDQSPSQVEFMITPAKFAKDLDIGSFAESSQFVRLPSSAVSAEACQSDADDSIRSIMSGSLRRTNILGRPRVSSRFLWS